MCNSRRAQAGLTLIELIVFIVIIGIGLAGILNTLNFTLTNSANPMIMKQQIAIAESLLEEISSKPFTYCDPDDANIATATSATVGAGNCASNAQGLGASPNTETRYLVGNPYDNVGDYHGFSMSGIKNPGDATAITGLANYSASVSISQVGATAPTNVGVAGDVLKIDVTVSAPGQTDLVLTGYRYRYAPNL